jgi:hypothetical protein
MKRIIIVNEGQTEQEFCKVLLEPHFSKNNIYIQRPTIKKTGGGIVAWETLKKQIETHLKQDQAAFVTTLIDYYGINGKLKFPKWEEAKAIVDKNKRMDFLEVSMKDLIDPKLSHRFIPYIQLHEFEGLLFSSIDVFASQIALNEFKDYRELVETIVEYPNPELINDGRTTAPSKRLERIIIGYNKPVYGSILAEAIGLQRIRSKCPRFNSWITTLETI